MIPSLIEQVIAARVPPKHEVISMERRSEKRDAVLEAVNAIGNARCAAVCKVVGLSDKPVRELLAELVNEDKLITWEVKKGCARIRMWAVKNPKPRRTK